MELYYAICCMTQNNVDMHFFAFHQMVSLHSTCLCVQDRERKIGFSMSCMAAKVRKRVDNFFSSGETCGDRFLFAVWPSLFEVLEHPVLVAFLFGMLFELL